jgi:predicted naringenin-chalcone synthase
MNSSLRFYLRGLALAKGTHRYSQERLAQELRDRLAHLSGAHSVGQMVNFVFTHSGIRHRHFEMTLEAIDARRDWYRLVNQAVESMAVRAVEVLRQKDPSVTSCDGLVVVSSSYAGFPSLGRRLQARFGFPPTASCYDLTGLGCAGPTQGLALAQALIEQGACRNVCLVCADAMGTHAQARHHNRLPSTAQLVAHCLASDGAAALSVGRDPGPAPSLRYTSSQLTSRLWEGALDQNDLTADEDNEPMVSVGKEIRDRLIPEFGKLLDAEARATPLLVHPGGAALMRQLKEHYPELSMAADLSLSVLFEHGNLGSPSVLWVLDRALRTRQHLSPSFRMVALGPGIVTTSLLFEGVERLAAGIVDTASAASAPAASAA